MREIRWARSGSLPILTIMASALIAPVSESASPDTSEWKCQLCPFENGYHADIAAGVSYVSEDTATFGDATGYDQKGGYANVDGSGRYAADAYRLSWQVEDLGLDSRVVEIEGARPGTFDYRLAYSQIPRHRFDSTSTIFTPAPGNLLALPSVWTFASTTSGFTDLAQGLVSQDIESERETLELGGRYLPTTRFRLFADYERQEHDGTNILGGSYFTNSSLLPHRFDYQTDQVDAGIRYDADNGYLKLAYYGSFFQDQFLAASWENPFLSAPGAETSALAESPDSNFQQLLLTGSYRTTALDTNIAFSAAMGRGKQNDTLLPYTTNPNVITAPLPRSSLDAEIDTTNLQLTVVSRPFPQARVKLAIRYDERDNKTSQLPWTRVIADSFLSGETEFNVPYGYERLRLNASADYRLFDTVRASAGYDYTELDRKFQEVAEQTEDTGWGRLQWRPNSYLELTARGGVSRRDINRYDETLAAGLDQNPLMRKYNLAYRYQQFGELSASATLPKWPIAISARAFYADDSYSDSQLGLTDSDELRVAADLSWSVSEKASVYLTGGFEDISTQQAGSAGFSTPDWFADYSDEFYNFGGGFRVTGIGGKVDLQLDYTRGKGNTEIDVTGGGGPSQFPDLETMLDSLRARILYHWSDKLEAGLQLRYENFSTGDWALQGVAPDTLPTILTLGAQPYDDDVWMASISFRYLIGER
ncbi:MAG: MtrB/PioB family decaheme-associated outer rane protein [Steroidobacteraceae bacterium]|nr:MtrB/PioB family decaheme-associated outer rane protein [Steroidobacteraceae bacterium]